MNTPTIFTASLLCLSASSIFALTSRCADKIHETNNSVTSADPAIEIIELSQTPLPDETDIDSIVLVLSNKTNPHPTRKIYEHYIIPHPDINKHISLDQGGDRSQYNSMDFFDTETEHEVLKLIDTLFITRAIPYCTEKEVEYIDSEPGYTYLTISFWCKNKVYVERTYCGTWRARNQTEGYERIFAPEFKKLEGIVRYYRY